MGDLTNTKSSLRKSERNIGFDVLRIIATYGVVVLHTSSSQWKLIDYNTFDWSVLTFYDSAVRWAVPVFVMISGALFLNADYPLERIYKKYILRIVTAFVFWSALYAVYDYHENHKLKTAVLLFFRGNYHLWFLYMIVGLYMLIPFLKLIVKDEKLTRYFLILAFFFSFLIPEAVFAITKISPYVGKYADAMLTNMHLDFVVGFTSFFILGYVFTKIKITKKLLFFLGVLSVIGFASTAFLTFAFSYYKEENVKQFMDDLTVNVLFEALFVFALYAVINKIRFGEKARTVIFRLSKYSFGVYLVHELVRMLIEKFFGLSAVSMNPIIGVPVVSITVLVISFAISAVLNNIPILKKYIV